MCSCSKRKLFAFPARLLGHFGNELLIWRGLLQYKIAQELKKNTSEDFGVTKCFSLHFPTRKDETYVIFQGIFY